MEIRLTHNFTTFIENQVAQAASEAGCFARVKWWMPHGARFTLHARNTDSTPASFEQHDAVIKSLLTIHPDARIRTARATYEGRADFEAQKQARVA
jgi:uncharacterized protein (DUF2461 family)